MHEASLVQGLLKLVGSAIDDYQATNPDKARPKLKEIICEAGLMACFEAQTLVACFEIFAEGTEAEGARLTIETAPLPCHCNKCGCDFQLLKRHFVCPACSGEDITFSGGNGLILQALNLDL